MASKPIHTVIQDCFCGQYYVKTFHSSHRIGERDWINIYLLYTLTAEGGIAKYKATLFKGDGSDINYSEQEKRQLVKEAFKALSERDPFLRDISMLT